MTRTPGTVNARANELYKCAYKVRRPNKKPSRWTLPIFYHTLLVVDDGNIIMATNDLEEIKFERATCEPGPQWAVCVPSKPFRDYLHVLGKDEIKLALDESIMSLYVLTSNSTAQFKCLDSSDFPTGTA